MLEQEDSPAKDVTTAPLYNMTQLEGIRQKVFMDRYSLKDADGKPLEFYPEQLWARVARGIAAAEQTEEKRDKWERLFYEALTDFKFVPGGRILAGAGTGHQVTYYNCMPPDQEVLTADGYRPISEIKIGDLVVTHRNRLRPVLHKFERETEEPLYIIRPKKVGYDDLRITGDHKVYVVRSEWVNKHRSRDGLRLQHEPDWIPAKEIKPGDYVAIVYNGEERIIDSKYYFEYDSLKWVPIDEIAIEDYSGTVLDIEVEEDHSFISASIVVSNCFVIPSPEDSRQGILDNLKVMTEIMARGGGVGINLSTLRPRGSYIKTVNGTASGPCSWAQLYSVATGDVIQQGGSRRGALMIMLDDTHPDIEEFITVKKQKGMIEHANLSVCISDTFMEAVKNDANWDLIWQGEVKKTIRARHLWDLICTSAWESAEPGVVFMDRCNKEANTWYYESIRCVNPCVTGETLVAIDHGRAAIPIKKLAEEEKDVPVLCTDLESETRSQHMRLGRFPRLTQKNAEVWKLTLSDGSTFRATPDHKMILSNGDIRQLKDLHLGDVLHSFPPTTSPKHKEVVSIEPDGYADVYNITVDDFHTVGYMTDELGKSGIFTLNCGEQPLPFWGVCNLGAINLSSFVKDGSMDWEQLAKVSKIAMRFLDNVIDATEYFIADNQEAQLGTRRTGLGTMGLADALIKMKVPYGSEGSLPIIEHIYATIRDAAYEASADIATEKGPFTQFDRDKYMQGKFVKRLPKPIQDKIKKQGIRNAVLLTQAPTGTTSLLAGVSSGIEPVYDFAMIRRDRTGEHILYHPLLQAWRDEHPDDPTPNYFVSSKDLTPEEHVRAQAMVQSYTDASISKTVNAPNDHTVEQVQKLYRLAYEMGCKGVTYYRDGSRDAVLTRVEDEKKAAATQTPSIEIVTSIHQGIKQRPAVVQGYTRQVNAPEGKVNVTINSDEQGPFEVFVNVGKAGSDIAALSEALGRLISLNLQILSPLSPMDRAQEICKQLRSIGGSRSVGFGVQQVRSLPDAVARALELHIEAVQTASNQETAHDEGDQTNNHNQQIPTSASLHPLKVTGNLCSQCGCNTMVYEEGCKKCYSCGYSEC